MDEVEENERGEELGRERRESIVDGGIGQVEICS